MAELFGYGQVFATNTADRSTEAKAPVGARGFDADGNEYVYLKAAGVIALGAPIDITDGLDAAAESADAKGFDAIATDTAFAASEYGFALTRGRGLALVPSGTALGDPLTAGAGALAAVGASTLPTRTATAQEAPVLLSGTTQLKYVYLH
jgi:hypothetical protein